ncbi:pyridoxal phosphate-dependent decarboxylase family protein [Nocardia terpenica]|uniref:Pyridoxal-dependent decarboxylase n=1 Tax=Nocardia terpenica TaxID=455432 RepID=A0A161XI68_9NOCA|nr:pyridoxal-dependent decarboxylase [Nocardia terpenica]KZM73338.1 hypothetical protein AWN90_32285 [Nocardia terpenica]NQE87510.1 hypothetical protein [Nocardia terpenica]
MDTGERLRRIVADYRSWRQRCGAPTDGWGEGPLAGYTRPAVDELLTELSANLSHESTPWAAPLYLAHMTGEIPESVALAYFCAMLYNPNNVVPEASPVTTRLEDEVAADLCRLIGYRPGEGWAHLCSGGHAANYEAIWMARNLRAIPYAVAETPVTHHLVRGRTAAELANLPVQQVLALLSAATRLGADSQVLATARRLRRTGEIPAATLLASANAHYAWSKCADLLALREFGTIPTDHRHAIDVAALRDEVVQLADAGRPIAAVVACVGSSGEGSVDDLPAIIELRDDLERTRGIGFHLHVDAAYGGYFRSMWLDETGGFMPVDPSDPVAAALRSLPAADTVTVDPHKNAHAPYPAGAIVIRDRALCVTVGTDIGSYFADGQQDPRMPYAPYTLEGGRPGAAAAGVWALHRLYPLDRTGLGAVLAARRSAARRWSAHVDRLPAATTTTGQPVRLFSCFEPDLAIVNIGIAGPTVDDDNAGRLIRTLAGRPDPAWKSRLWLSTNRLIIDGRPQWTLRSCLMNDLTSAEITEAGMSLLHALQAVLVEQAVDPPE